MMSKINKCLKALANFFVGALVSIFSTPCYSAQEKLLLELSEVDSGSGIFEVAISNETSQGVIMPLLFFPEDYYIRFEIRGAEDGQLRRYLGDQFDWVNGPEDFLTMYPGSRFSQNIDLKEPYKLTSNCYSIVAKYEVTERRRKEIGLWVGKLESNKLNFCID